MPSVGRKLLMAGRAGLNLTHTEPIRSTSSRVTRRHRPPRLPLIEAFRPEDLRAWCEGPGAGHLRGVERAGLSPGPSRPRPCCAPGWRGSSGSASGFALRHRWQGWDGEAASSSPDPPASRSGEARRRHPGARRRELAAARLRRGRGSTLLAGAASPSRRCAPANMGFVGRPGQTSCAAVSRGDP